MRDILVARVWCRGVCMNKVDWALHCRWLGAVGCKKFFLLCGIPPIISSVLEFFSSVCLHEAWVIL